MSFGASEGAPPLSYYRVGSRRFPLWRQPFVRVPRGRASTSVITSSRAGGWLPRLSAVRETRAPNSLCESKDANTFLASVRAAPGRQLVLKRTTALCFRLLAGVYGPYVTCLTHCLFEVNFWFLFCATYFPYQSRREEEVGQVIGQALRGLTLLFP